MALFWIRVQGQLVAMDAREADEGGYYASFPDFKGCHTEGATLAELAKNAEEAVELYLEPIPPKPRTRRSPSPKAGAAKKVRP